MGWESIGAEEQPLRFGRVGYPGEQAKGLWEFQVQEWMVRLCCRIHRHQTKEVPLQLSFSFSSEAAHSSHYVGLRHCALQISSAHIGLQLSLTRHYHSLLVSRFQRYLAEICRKTYFELLSLSAPVPQRDAFENQKA